MKKYIVKLDVRHEINAETEEEALAIFHDDLMRAWSEEELAEIQEITNE